MIVIRRVFVDNSTYGVYAVYVVYDVYAVNALLLLNQYLDAVATVVVDDTC